MSNRPPPLRILSVEDDLVNRALLRASLQRAPNARLAAAELVEVSDLRGARRALAQGNYDLVLLDRRLPDGDGFELAGELRQNGDRRPVLIALTADAVPATHGAALTAGCDAVLTKPYSPASLVELVESQLESRGLS